MFITVYVYDMTSHSSNSNDHSTNANDPPPRSGDMAVVASKPTFDGLDNSMLPLAMLRATCSHSTLHRNLYTVGTCSLYDVEDNIARR